MLSIKHLLIFMRVKRSVPTKKCISSNKNAFRLKKSGGVLIKYIFESP